MQEDIITQITQYPNWKCASSRASVRKWFHSELTKPGPWLYEHGKKKEIHTLLLVKLTVEETDTTAERRCLQCDDSDEVWVKNICERVLPRLDHLFKAE